MYVYILLRISGGRRRKGEARALRWVLRGVRKSGLKGGVDVFAVVGRSGTGGVPSYVRATEWCSVHHVVSEVAHFSGEEELVLCI